MSLANLIEIATNEKQTEDDWTKYFNVCKMGAQNNSSKACLRLILRRLFNENPHIVLRSITLLDACVQYIGELFMKELSSSYFVCEIKSKSKNINQEALERLCFMMKKWSRELTGGEYACINELNKWLQDNYPTIYAAGDDELNSINNDRDIDDVYVSPVTDHGGTDNGDNDNGDTDHGGTDHGDNDHGDNDHGDNDHGDTDHGDTDHGDNDHGDNDHGDSDHGDNDHGDNDHGDSDHGGTDNGDTDQNAIINPYDVVRSLKDILNSPNTASIIFAKYVLNMNLEKFKNMLCTDKPWSDLSVEEKIHFNEMEKWLNLNNPRKETGNQEPVQNPDSLDINIQNEEASSV